MPQTSGNSLLIFYQSFLSIKPQSSVTWLNSTSGRQERSMTPAPNCRFVFHKNRTLEQRRCPGSSSGKGSGGERRLFLCVQRPSDVTVSCSQAIGRFKEWERKHKEQAATFQFQQECLQRIRMSLTKSREMKRLRGELVGVVLCWTLFLWLGGMSSSACWNKVWNSSTSTIEIRSLLPQTAQWMLDVYLCENVSVLHMFGSWASEGGGGQGPPLDVNNFSRKSLFS